MAPAAELGLQFVDEEGGTVAIQGSAAIPG
jgi:hypothetical protein